MYTVFISILVVVDSIVLRRQILLIKETSFRLEWVISDTRLIKLLSINATYVDGYVFLYIVRSVQ